MVAVLCSFTTGLVSYVGAALRDKSGADDHLVCIAVSNGNDPEWLHRVYRDTNSSILLNGVLFG